MWLRFSFTACSASETKFAPITGTRSALQYCFTLACSKTSVAGFIAPPPPLHRAADHTRSSPATDVRSAPVRATRTAPPAHAPVLRRPADAAPPPRPCNPDPALAGRLAEADPSHAYYLPVTTRSWFACQLACPRELPDSATIGRNCPASARFRATAATAAIPPTLPACAPTHRDSALSRAPADSVRSCRSEEHTSALQSPCNLVCRLL